MNNDKAIIKALQSTNSSGLSSNFNAHMMDEVYRAVGRKKKRAYVFGLCLVSGVSLVLIGLAVYLFYTYFSFNLQLELPKFPKMHFTSESKSLYEFSIYIALLSLVLIGLDNYIRHKWMIKKSK